VEAQEAGVSDGRQVVPVPPSNVAEDAYLQRSVVAAAAAVPEQTPVLVSPRV
jgi:hypothetical protein